MSDTACAVNLGPRGRRQRLGAGLAMGLVVAAAIVLIGTQDVGRPLRLLVFVPLFVGALGFFQAAAST